MSREGLFLPVLVLPPVPALSRESKAREAAAAAVAAALPLTPPARHAAPPARPPLAAADPLFVHELAVDASSGATSRLAQAWRLKLVVVLVEIALSLVAGSVLLAADAIHMSVDLAAFGIAWLAAVHVRRSGSRTDGRVSRFELAAATCNALVLTLAAWHVIGHALEALEHGDHHVNYFVAAIAAGIRLAASHRAWRIMQDGDLDNPNELAIEQHCRMETYASTGLVVTLLFAALTGAEFADPLLALVVAALMLRAAYGILRITVATQRRAADSRLR
jgi:cation diffusion facilitator family transporter